MVRAVADGELLFVLATNTQVEVFALFAVNSSSNDEALTLVTLEPDEEHTDHIVLCMNSLKDVLHEVNNFVFVFMFIARFNSSCITKNKD